MKNKTGVIILVLVVIIIGLFVVQRMLVPGAGASWEDTDIACLRGGHQNINQHFHPTLSIVVDGEEEPIPASIGIRGNCMAEAHTHDATGVIHFESVASGKQFTLDDFFVVWDRDIERPGYSLVALMNGETVRVEDLRERVLKDHDEIILTYTSHE